MYHLEGRQESCAQLGTEPLPGNKGVVKKIESLSVCFLFLSVFLMTMTNVQRLKASVV